jgi:hypothetical protein
LVCSLWNRCRSSSGADQSISPAGPAVKPSTETPIEEITFAIEVLLPRGWG